jgi:putative ABC transport system permease protein
VTLAGTVPHRGRDRAPELTDLALAGVVIAVAGALLPAAWATRSSTASALHAE